jgi:hypothetical protein
MDNNALVTDEAMTGVASATVENNQGQTASERMFTQEEVNMIIAKRAEKMAKQKFGHIDVEEYQELKSAKEKAQKDELIRKQKFEEVLKQQKEQYDSEIVTLRSQLTSVKIDGAVLDAASKYGAVSPHDVAALMKNSIQLDSNGNPVVLDSNGNVRYDPATAEALTVDRAVQEFLESKPFFKAAGPAGAGTRGNAQPVRTEQLKLSDLDMKNPEHRKIYAEKMDPRRVRNFYSS